MFNVQIFCNNLLQWYQYSKRDLPWRNTRDPYFIWISEIMLQQTRVETVIAYYQRFTSRFPDIFALAAAPEAEVLKLWEGLGYYSRARNLHKAAKIVVSEYGGAVPMTAQTLRLLPGVGAYTAGAIASIAYGEPAPAVDGNVKRVMARLLGIREDINSKANQQAVHETLTAALTTCDAGTFNQAMMELGATLCSPRSPKCDLCPVAALCDALAQDDQESLPIMEPKNPPVVINVGVALLTYADQVLLLRRDQRLLQGLYVFYLIEDETRPQQIIDALSQEGLHATFERELGEAKHIFTHRIWLMKLMHFTLPAPPSDQWLTGHDAVMANALQLNELPLPTAMKAAKKAAEQLLGESDAHINKKLT